MLLPCSPHYLNNCYSAFEFCEFECFIFHKSGNHEVSIFLSLVSFSLHWQKFSIHSVDSLKTSHSDEYRIPIVCSSATGVLARFHIFVNITLLDTGVRKSLQGLNFIDFHNYPDCLRIWSTESEGVSFYSLCLPC